MTNSVSAVNTLPLILPVDVEAMTWSDDELLGVLLVACEVTGSSVGHDALTRFVAAELRRAAFAELRRRNPGPLGGLGRGGRAPRRLRRTGRPE